MFQPGLVDELIDQVAGEAGALPLLEYTLESLWASKQPDGTMTWDAYRTIGGVEGALAAGADRVLQEWYREPEQREAIRELLLRLVQPGDEMIHSRRRMPLRELVPAGRTVEDIQIGMPCSCSRMGSVCLYHRPTLATWCKRCSKSC